jgi:hypothetical protein
MTARVLQLDGMPMGVWAAAAWMERSKTLRWLGLGALLVLLAAIFAAYLRPDMLLEFSEWLVCR